MADDEVQLGHDLLNNPCVEVEEGDGEWTIGWKFNALSCGRITQVMDDCAAPTPSELDPVTEQAAPGYRIDSFSLYSRQMHSTMCLPEQAEPAAISALECATDTMIAGVLWNGEAAIETTTPGSWQQEIFIDSAEVATVNGGSVPTSSFGIRAALATLIDAAYADHPEIGCCSIIHLGTQAAFELSSVIKRLRLNVVISPAYPTLGMAITGPIGIRLGSIAPTSNIKADNRMWTEATRIAAFEFDPCLAKRLEFA